MGHDWVEATCLVSQTCARCKTTLGEALGHSWIEAACTTAKTCELCGTTDGDPLGHDTAGQTCTVDVTCFRCNEIFPAPGHSEKTATCTDVAVCTVCGEVLGEALGHSWVDATCTTAKTCSVCNVNEGDALGHTWTDATCTTAKTCSVCTAAEGSALGHTWTDATCTTAKTCSVCWAVEGSALGHNWTDATCTEVKFCSRCNLTEGTALGHSTTSGTCSRCGLEVYETVSGYGDDVVSDITVGDGIYRLHFTHSGGSNFIVKSYDATNDYELLINEIGNYDGYVLLLGKSPYAFEITAGGSWTYTIEPLEIIEDTAFAGWGDYVTGLCSISSGAWVFTHDGNSNFVVRIYTTDGRDLLVNEIGYYNGKKMITIPKGSYAFFEINADGNWTISKA